MNRALSALIVSLPFALAVSAKEVSLDYRATAVTPQLAAAVPGDGLVRSSFLPSAKTLSAASAALDVGDTVTLALFSDVSLEVTVERVNVDPFGPVYEGAIGGVRCVSLIPTEGGFAIDARDVAGSRVYKVLPSAGGTVVQEYAPESKGKCGNDALESVKVGGSGILSALAEEPADAQAAVLLDVLVVYDAGALSWVAQNGGGALNFARAAVAKANEAIANTGLDAKFAFRLVGVTNVTYSTKDVGTGLNAICTSTGGIGNSAYSAVHALRTTLGADLVVSLVDTESAYGTTGLGWSLESLPVSGFSENAYCCCAIRSVAISDTMTHEMGHNLGAGHVNVRSDTPGPQWGSVKPYSSGYYFTGTDAKDYCTVMAYDQDNEGNNYVPAPYFSSPDYTYQGAAVGTAAANDNTRVLRETYAAASAWRTQTVPVTYGVTFSPAGGATFASSITVTLTPGASGLSIYYTLNGTTPTTSSTRYTGPLTFTQTTTISAVTWDGSNLSPVYTATFSKSDLGVGLDAPQLSWTTLSTYPWSFETTNTHDTVDAVQFVLPDIWKSSWLATSVYGPTRLSFWYTARKYFCTFSVSVDGTDVFTDSDETSGGTWVLAQIAIPAGTHAVKFSFENNGGFFGSGDYGYICIDEIAFDKYSAAPTFSPATTAVESTAKVFTNSLSVALSAAEGASIYYTTDGTDPTTGSALYTGPLTITASTMIAAIAVENGRDPSPVAKAFYLERHPIGPGEWTTDIAQAQTLAAKNGGQIVCLLASLATCDYCKAFNPIAESAAFLAWAKANGFYLVTADATRHPDTAAAADFFWEKWNAVSSGGVSYPTMVVCSGSGTAEGYMLAHSGQTVNGVTYTGTSDSLSICLATFLGSGSLLGAPAVTPNDSLVDGFPVTATLSNTNSAGTVHYTLDGTAPTKSSPTYTGAVTISAGTTLLAAVWPASGASSPVTARTYQTISSVLGTSGVSWSRSGSPAWRAGTAAGTMQSGAFTATGSSVLQGVFTGKGTLIYTVAIETYASNNKLVISVDGSQTYSQGYGGSTSYTKTFTNTFTTAAAHTVKWTHTIGDYAHYYSTAAVLSALSWTPQGSGVTATEVPVPYTWLNTYWPTLSTVAAYNAAALADSDGDGFVAWQEYLCGTDPTDGADFLRATIRFKGATPIVEWNVTNSTLATYTVLGTSNLGTAFTAPTNSASRFFRVRVLPK